MAHATEHGFADENPIGIGVQVHFEMLSVREVHLGGSFFQIGEHIHALLIDDARLIKKPHIQDLVVKVIFEQWEVTIPTFLVMVLDDSEQFIGAAQSVLRVFFETACNVS